MPDPARTTRYVRTIRAQRRADRMRFLRAMPLRQSVALYAAVACTFGTIGFVGDLAALPELKPFPSVLATVLMSGVVACGYLAAAVHGLKWMPLAFAAQLVLTGAIHRFLPAGIDPRLHAPALAAMAERARADGIGCLLVAMAGYGLFIVFISMQGVRQVRLDTEMALAKDIHAGLVPPVSRRTPRFEIEGRSLPSTEVGGDLLDVLDDRGRMLAVVVDVSGHGVPAGTLMAMIRSAIRVRVASGCSLEELFADLDRLLLDLDRPNTFATAACLLLDERGEAEALLAGHLPILVVRRDRGGVERIENRRPPIGIPGPMSTDRFRFAPGDVFAILTDGLPETADASGRTLDLEAIEAVLRERAEAPLRAVADAVFQRASRHGPATDDRTLLLVRAL